MNGTIIIIKKWDCDVNDRSCCDFFKDKGELNNASIHRFRY